MGFIRVRAASVFAQIFPGTNLHFQGSIGVAVTRVLGFLYYYLIEPVFGLLNRLPLFLSRYKQSSFVLAEKVSRKTKIFVPFVYLYYWTAVRSLQLMKALQFPCRFNIYTRHQNWNLGASDIDLIVVYDEREFKGENDRSEFFQQFYEALGWLRVLFPMLCAGVEVRFLSKSRFERHPLEGHPELELVCSPSTWKPALQQIYDIDFAWIRNSSKKLVEVPMTKALGNHLLGPIQTLLFKSRLNRHFSATKFSKCTQKCAQCLRTPSNLAGSPPLTKVSAAELLLKLILLVDQEYGSPFAPKDGKVSGSKEKPDWLPPVVDQYLWATQRKFGEHITVVVQRPFFQLYEQFRVVGLVSNLTDPNRFAQWVTFSYDYTLKFKKIRARIISSTAALMASQSYQMWGETPLEAEYFSTSQNLYAPTSEIRIAVPPESWSLLKLREALLNLEESQLPQSVMFDGDKELTETALYKALAYYLVYARDPEEFARALPGPEAGMLARADVILNELGISTQSVTSTGRINLLCEIISNIDRFVLARLKHMKVDFETIAIRHA